MNLLERINQLEVHFNETEPGILAFIPEQGRFDRLRREAQTAIEAYPDAAARPPLFGALLGVKDIFYAEGFETRAGSQLPPEILHGPEAKAVTRLKQAGALVIGKTVTTEFAFFAPGPTRNPHDPGHTPGGSSSGSAAAIAAGLCDIALGSQTIGSVNRPAAFCGVVGFKPSFDRISKEGVIQLAVSLDHVGVFAKTVGRTRHAAAVLVNDWNPARSVDVPAIGIPDSAYLDHTEPEGREHFNRVCEFLGARRFRIKRVRIMPDFDEIYARHYLINRAEAARFHEPWFAKYGHLYHHRTAEMIEAGKAVSDKDLKMARLGQELLRDQLMSRMIFEGIDIWVSPPAIGPAPAGLSSTGDPVMNLPWTHAGLPTLSIPAGKAANGLPLGLQVAAGWRADEQLFGWGEQIEAALQEFAFA